MGNGIWTAGIHARQRFPPGYRFARRTTVFNLFPVLFGYSGDRLFPERVILVLSDFKDTIRAGCHTFFTTIAFVCVDNDKVLAGPVFITVMGKHLISVLF
jgi:hypothetical protein